jgi:hypothetical protein
LTWSLEERLELTGPQPADRSAEGEMSAMVGVAHTGMPRHIVWRTNNDCAIATVAMAANLPYRE